MPLALVPGHDWRWRCRSSCPEDGAAARQVSHMSLDPKQSCMIEDSNGAPHATSEAGTNAEDGSCSRRLYQLRKPPVPVFGGTEDGLSRELRTAGLSIGCVAIPSRIRHRLDVIKADGKGLKRVPTRAYRISKQHQTNRMSAKRTRPVFQPG